MSSSRKATQLQPEAIAGLEPVVQKNTINIRAVAHAAIAVAAVFNLAHFEAQVVITFELRL
jgi:hypothetical protein